MIYWNPDPVIFRIGLWALRWYSLMFMIAFLLGYLIFKWIFIREQKKVEVLESLFIHVFFGTLIGARLGHCIFYDPIYYFKNPLEILQVWKGGLASHGAAIGILTSIYLFTRKNRDYSYIWILDRLSIVVALGGVFVRLGNLFNSEIIGRPTSLPWAFIFLRVDRIPRHPTQLYEAFAYLWVFIILFHLYRRSWKTLASGKLLGVFMLGIFGSRFLIEFLKENQSAFEASLPLNMGQLLSLPFILLGLWMLLRRNPKPDTMK